MQVTEVEYIVQWAEDNRSYEQKYKEQMCFHMCELFGVSHINCGMMETYSVEHTAQKLKELCGRAGSLVIGVEPMPYSGIPNVKRAWEIVKASECENAKIIHKLCEYWECVLRMPLEGRLLLLKIGMALEKVTGRKSIDHIVDELFKYSQEKADLKQMSREELRDYFSWILGRVLEFRLTAEEFSMIYDLFAMTKYADSIFMEYCCKTIYKKCKNMTNEI